MNSFEQEIITFLKEKTGAEVELATPPNADMGDYAFACFVLAKEQQKKPNEVAEELATQFEPTELIEKAQAFGPYCNFFVNKTEFIKETVQRVFEKKSEYGNHESTGKTIMVEFFHANTHKGVHIGHVRNISLSSALCRTLEAAGNNVIRVNYQGDIGPHVAKCLWGYLNLGEHPPETKKEEWLGQLYAKANTREKESDQVKEQIREINKKLYAKDPELIKLWQTTRQWCLDEFEDIYTQFGFSYDRCYFESEVVDKGIEIANDLYKKGIAKDSEGAIIMDLEEYKLGIYVLLTKDRHAVYQTKDLGLADQKLKEYDVDKSIHIVGKEQELYFKQVFKTLELMGSPLANKSYHLKYELVMLPEGKMSSREGNVILYNALLKTITETAKKEVDKRHEDWAEEQKEQSAENIAFGALKFGMISKENNRKILFDWNKALDFEGDTGPYVQYTHARICSLLRKYGKNVSKNTDFSSLSHALEIDLSKKIALYPSLVQKAAAEYKMHLVCQYLLDLCRTYSEFYHAVPILKESDGVKDARVALSESTRQVIENGLTLLGIVAPDRM